MSGEKPVAALASQPMASSQIQFRLNGIGHLIRDELLGVPIYQRSYAWEKDQVDDFCSDLRNAFNSPLREYFMGTVVLSDESGDRKMVIDGQQRLATTTILFAAIRNHQRANGEVRKGDSIHSTYVGSYDDRTDEDVPRLSMNAEDDSHFRTTIVEDEDATSTRDSHILISGAYAQAKEFVAEQASAAGTAWSRKLVEWREFLDNDVSIIEVTVANESDAFLIFETLNDRGADLTLADLLKNYLFGRAGSAKLHEVRENWILALAAMDNVVESFVIFLRHYWSSKNGLVRERDLYKAIKSEVATGAQAVKFSKELLKASKLYAALLNSASEYWTKWSDVDRRNIDTLGLLALEQNRPMLLAVLENFSTPESKKVLRACVSWSVRGLVVGGIGGGTTEKAYCQAAVRVSDGSIKSAKDLLAELSSIVPPDDAFQSSFATFRVTKTSLARYYLRALESARRGDAEPELVPNPDPDQVNLEHVLAKNAKPSDWPTFKPDEIRTWADRFGNMVLLGKTANNSLGNKPFSGKKAVLAASKSLWTSEGGSYADWTPATVDSRQSAMAALAVKVWKREP